jgi:hypothetical protein
MTFKINWYTPTKPRHFCIIGHGLLNIGTELLSMLFSWSVHMRLKFGTKITSQEWIFWTFNKKFTSRSILWRVKLYFESTKEKDCFIFGRSSYVITLEVGHWVAQTQTFFDKLPEITGFGILQQSLTFSYFGRPKN